MKGSTIINTVNGWNGLSIKEFENKSSYKVLKLERPQTIDYDEEILCDICANAHELVNEIVNSYFEEED